MAPSVSAHPRATPIEAPNGERCYIFWNDMEEPEFWMETNGKLTGGVPEGTPFDHHLGLQGPGSGLQRGGDSDTRMSHERWAERCGLPAD